MNDVTALLERATTDLRPSRDLVAGGIATGRRRRRCSVAVLGASGAAAAVLTVGAFFVLPGSGGAEPVPLATDPPPTVAPAAPPPTRFGPAPAAMASTLATVLEDQGIVTEPEKWGDPGGGGEQGFQAGSVLLDGAQVTMLLQHTTEPRCGELAPAATCEPYGDGYLSTLTTEDSVRNQPTGVIGSSAVYYAPGGLVVAASALNAPAEKGSDPIMDEPVLDVAALTDLVLDDVWLD